MDKAKLMPSRADARTASIVSSGSFRTGVAAAVATVVAAAAASVVVVAAASVVTAVVAAVVA